MMTRKTPSCETNASVFRFSIASKNAPFQWFSRTWPSMFAMSTATIASASRMIGQPRPSLSISRGQEDEVGEGPGAARAAGALGRLAPVGTDPVLGRADREIALPLDADRCWSGHPTAEARRTLAARS